MYRFLLTPRWLAGHVIVAVVVASCVALGFWQLDRHEERAARNARTEERLAAPPVDLADVDASAGELAYRRVRVRGRYVTDAQLLLTPRSWNGRSGHHLLTPLVDARGTGVLVVRGWVPFELDQVPAGATRAPDGEVVVEGIVFPDEPPTRFGPSIPEEGTLERVARVDVERIQQQVAPQLRPFYVQLTAQDPPQQGDLPLPAAEPVLDAGNHLPYAVQWFLFATVGLVGYPLLVRRTARDEPRDPAPANDPSLTRG